VCVVACPGGRPCTCNCKKGAVKDGRNCPGRPTKVEEKGNHLRDGKPRYRIVRSVVHTSFPRHALSSFQFPVSLSPLVFVQAPPFFKDSPLLLQSAVENERGQKPECQQIAEPMQGQVQVLLLLLPAPSPSTTARHFSPSDHLACPLFSLLLRVGA
jgi:hypothetical protein